MRKCVYARVRACVRACVCACARACAYVQMCERASARVRVRVLARTCMCTRMRAPVCGARDVLFLLSALTRTLSASGSQTLG